MTSDLRRTISLGVMGLGYALACADLVVFALGSHIAWWPRHLSFVTGPLIVVGCVLSPMFFREYSREAQFGTQSSRHAEE